MATETEDNNNNNNRGGGRKKRDTSSLVILSVVIIFVISASLLAMGAVPQIFRTAERTDTLETVLNESLIVKQQQEAFSKQAQAESLERIKQNFIIINESNKTIKDMGDGLKQYINDSENRSAKAAKERNAIMDRVLDIIDELNHTRYEHDRIVIEAQNTTNHVEDELYRYGENSIEQFNKLIDNQKEIINLLKNSS